MRPLKNNDSSTLELVLSALSRDPCCGSYSLCPQMPLFSVFLGSAFSRRHELTGQDFLFHGTLLQRDQRRPQQGARTMRGAVGLTWARLPQGDTHPVPLLPQAGPCSCGSSWSEGLGWRLSGPQWKLAECYICWERTTDLRYERQLSG